mmetsp:Transcript_27891/g.59492  ORF Transcript_27891/g.59492 Transcript_27891/m.59492 type:complete len:1002 (-) Transcript_27891:169-3174(-)
MMDPAVNITLDGWHNQDHIRIDHSDAHSISTTSSSQISFTSFKDLKNAWETVSLASSSHNGGGNNGSNSHNGSSSHHDGNGRSSKQQQSRRKKSRPHHNIRQSCTNGSATRSYANQLYGRNESPCDTTTASTSGGRKSEKANGKRQQRKRGDLARQFDEAQSSILNRHGIIRKEDAAAAGCDDNHNKDTSQPSQPSQQQQGVLEKASKDSTAMINSLQNDLMGLMMNNPTMVHSLSSNQGPCDICQHDDHATLRCRVLTDEQVSQKVLGRLIQSKQRLEKEQQARCSASPKNDHVTKEQEHNGKRAEKAAATLALPLISQNNDTPPKPNPTPQTTTTTTKEELVVNTAAITAGLAINTPPPELNAFLTSPTGFNWEDLVRSLKNTQPKQSSLPLLNTMIIVNLDDDAISALGGDDGYNGNNVGNNGKSNKYSYVGDNECMGNVVVASHMEQGYNANGNDHDEYDEEDDDEVSTSSSISSKSMKKLLNNNRAQGEKETGDDLVKLVERVITGKMTKEEGTTDSILGKTVVGGVGECRKEERYISSSSPAVSSTSRRRPTSPRSKSLPRDSLERIIEKVITEQQIQMNGNGNGGTITTSTFKPEQKEAAGKKKKIPPLGPPPRSKSLSPRKKWNPKNINSDRQKVSRIVGSSIGSAFSPIKASSSGNTSSPCCSPTTPGTAAETTFDHSSSSSSRMSTPANNNNDSRRKRDDDLLVFSPIERHAPNSPLILPPEPISPKARRSPRRVGSSNNVHVAPRMQSSSSSSPSAAAVRRRAEERATRQRNCDSPSDPPMIMAVSTDEITITSNTDELLLMLKQHGDKLAATPLAVVDPPLLTMSTSEEVDKQHDEVHDDETGDSFYHQIRGRQNLLDDEHDNDALALLAAAAFEGGDGGKRDDGSGTVAPFPTCWDAATAAADGNIINRNSINVPNEYGVVDEAIDNSSGSPKNVSKKNSVCTTSATTATTTTSTMTIILPESLSINKRNPTCWQITRHRVRRTKGEF